MTNENQSLPAAIELYARLTMPKMDGWCQPEKAIEIAMCVVETKPEVALEIGVYAGRSLIAIALGLKHNLSGKVIGIDPWTKAASVQGWDDANKEWWNKLNHDLIKQKCELSIVKAEVQDYVELIQATSKDALPIIQARNLAIGLLSIDGNHSPEQSCFDVENYVPMVSSGGHIFFDDADWETTQDAIKLIMKTCKLKEIVGNCAVFVKI